ncbi:8-oxo-dGTP diphosphatase [Virgibacillus necropolis]|uniref:NUDIX hydrolase n=1 Tax=Virgibacillus necropolis TaxID=163877 RepID=A0A221MAV4_9BACI|nr:8-oxo-dGTP diphosphatase [Virgibacillus necropolis]ASN04757.1 NUDIX hydrolase [Virgibacillus necropolis]
MQRVTNCILIQHNKVLLLKKPRRGWYAIPGGKMEPGESIKESVVREYREETSLHLQNPELAGAFTFTVHNAGEEIKEWMMFTFVCNVSKGELTEHCDEGILEWVAQEHVHELPMAEGDRKIFEHVLSKSGMLYGSFSYTNDYDLLDMRLDPSTP